METVKNEQQSLEHELDFILAQQKELEELLKPLEKQLLEDSSDRMRDPEREHMYVYNFLFFYVHAVFCYCSVGRGNLVLINSVPHALPKS